jgi:hypothetical protein
MTPLRGGAEGGARGRLPVFSAQPFKLDAEEESCQPEPASPNPTAPTRRGPARELKLPSSFPGGRWRDGNRKGGPCGLAQLWSASSAFGRHRDGG